MPITAEQARTELRRRQAVAELRRRGIDANIPQKSTVGDTGRLPKQDRGIVSEPVNPQEQAYLKQIQWFDMMVRNGRIKPEKSFWGKMQEEIPQMTGETAGGLAGAVVGLKAGTRMFAPGALPPLSPWAKGASIFAGAVIGAGVGAMGGKGYQQLYRMDKGESMTMGQILKEQGFAGLEGAVSEAAGAGVVKGVGKVARPLISKVIPGAPRLSRILTEAGKRMPTDDLTPYARKILSKKGAFLSAAQLTESKGMDFVESATESTIFGGNRLFQIKRVINPRAYRQAAQELSDTFWSFAEKRLSPEEMGQAFVDSITGGRKVQSRLQRIAYGQIDELTQGMGRPFGVSKTLRTGLGKKPLVQKITIAHKAALDLRPIKKAAAGIKAVASRSKLGSAKYSKRIADAVSKWPDFADDFMSAHRLRSDLLEEVRNFEQALNIKLPKVHRNADLLAALTDRTMAKAAKEHSPEAYMAWRAANKLTKEGKKVLNNDIINGAMKLAYRNPEKVAPIVFRPHGTKTLKAVRKAVDDKTYRALLASKLDNLMTSSARDEILVGRTFKRKLLDLGSDMHEVMFDSPQHFQDVLDLANLGEIIQAPTGGGGGMVAQLTQAGAIIDLTVGLPTGQGLKKGSGVILLGPALIGRLFSTPAGARWLSTGFKTQNPKFWAKMPPVVARIIREYSQAQLAERRKVTRRKQQRPFGRHF